MVSLCRYKLAENINGELDQMSNSLKEIITKLNAANDRSSEQKANPVYQITEILNSHLHTLQWVDNANTQLDSKLKQVEKQFKFHQGQQQHLHRLRTGRPSMPHPAYLFG